jgi:hypothetical protein
VGVHDAVAIALKVGARAARRLGVQPTTALLRVAGVGLHGGLAQGVDMGTRNEP